MGFVKLNNDLKSWEWFHDNNTLAVYVRLLLGAAWCETRYENVRLKRGQLVIRQTEFAEKCGLSRQNLRTILERLVAGNKINQASTTKFTVITVLDYDCAANNQPTVNQPSANAQPTTNQPTLSNKKDNNIKKQETRAPRGGVGDDHLFVSFECFWEAYPKKCAKQRAMTAWERLDPDEETVNRIMTALERQKRTSQWTRENGRFIPEPQNWLNNRRWEDEIPPETAPRGNCKSPRENEAFKLARERYRQGVSDVGGTPPPAAAPRSESPEYQEIASRFLAKNPDFVDHGEIARIIEIRERYRRGGEISPKTP